LTTKMIQLTQEILETVDDVLKHKKTNCLTTIGFNSLLLP
jgi:hypothetical protein